MSNAQVSPLQKFQGLLRELFQFDCADLDFGIYRIMNHKRDVVERFISTKLPQAVDAELESGTLARQAKANADLADAREEVVRSLGADAIDAAGDVPAEFAATPVAKIYLAAKSRAGTSRSRAALESDVYNHLYTFFSRYYQDGDFISKRRYSRSHRYAIPYNGEEVHLHWANSDQYYIKTEEHFHGYQWKSPYGVSVRFHVDAADVEQNNVKGERRFFVPQTTNATWDASDRRLEVPFAYRPLSKAEQANFGSNGVQEKIIARAVEELPKQFAADGDAVATLIAESSRNTSDEAVTYLEHHLRQYTRRNDSDFFIHKDLRGFLSRELDFFLKNEVLNVDDMAAAGEHAADGWFQLLQLVKRIGGQIIDFLAQIEGFQKTLWEKRKFVVEAQYCVSLAQVGSVFYAEILANDGQWREWNEIVGDCDAERSESFLQSHPSLVLDTRYFEPTFKDRLLASFTDIEDVTDGVLIHGENWQALRLLEPRFRSSIPCLYIDPPYNTGDSKILYKNGYLSSSWLTMMENRLSAVVPLLTDDPTCYIAIDDFEMADLCMLVDSRLPSLRREMIIVNHHPQGGKASTLSSTHEYMLTCLRRDSNRTLKGRAEREDVERRPFKRSGTAESNFRYGRPNSFYAILVDRKTSSVVGLERPPAADETSYPTLDTDDGHARVYPIGVGGEERVWRRSYESCLSLLNDRKLICTDGMTVYQLVDPTDKTPALFSNWTDSRYNAGTQGANLLADILGRHNPFPYPKSVHTVGDAVFAVGELDGYFIDYFAGSGTTGHAVVNVNREDGGRRKFLLVDAGAHFETVLLPRIKRVVFTPEWRAGKPKRLATQDEAERSPRIIKYIRMESYEDALDSIQFDERAGLLNLEDRIDGDLLKYILKWETKDSETLLNPAKLVSPFDYRLRVHANGDTVDQAVDLPDTFNYLLGLKVRTRRVYMDGDRRYLVFRGEPREAPGRSTVVIWRDTSDWGEADLKRDKAFVAENRIIADADTAYVNGLSAIVGARSIEPLFKERMFAAVQDRD